MNAHMSRTSEASATSPHAVVEAAWKTVNRRSHAADQEAIAALRPWLSRQANPHAAVLSGQPTTRPADDQSARELEALIVARCVSHELTLTTVAQQLNLLHRVGKLLRKQEINLAPTWITSIVRPHPSPFPTDTALAMTKVERWRESLDSLVATGLEALSVDELWSIALLSAVLHGALLDRAKLIRLRLMLSRHEEIAVQGQAGDEHAYVEFLMPFAGFGNHHLQRWLVDPMTELLLGRLGRSPTLPSFKDTSAILNAVLIKNGIEKTLLPTSVKDLLHCAKAWWATRAAPVDLHAMQRTFAAHSLTTLCWTRITGKPSAIGLKPIVGAGCGERYVSPSAETESELFNAAEAEHEWLREVHGLLEGDDLDAAKEAVRRYSESIDEADYRKAYVGWLCHALAAPPRNAKIGAKLHVRSLPFLLAAPRLLNYLGDRKPQALDVAELDETYRTILDGCDPHEPIERIARGLRLFHDYLVRHHRVARLPNPRTTFGEGGSLMPVDATLVSVEEYLAALKWLDDQVEAGADPDDIMVCRLVLVIAFRGGLRRREIFGLRLCDVHDCGSLSLLVRPYRGHRLKTPSATRVVPIGALLSVHERQWLRAWWLRRTAEEASRPGGAADDRSPRLLARPGAGMDAVSIDGVVRRTMHAVHAVTGEPRLHLHHLRHSCGSWLWLKLRAPDHTELHQLLSTMPALLNELKTAGRVRIALCGSADGPSRSYTYAVAKILGHSSPAVSLAHYLHVGDLFLAATVLREASKTRVEVWQGLTRASRSTAYAWMSRGPHGVVVGSRAKAKGGPSETLPKEVERSEGSHEKPPSSGGSRRLTSRPQVRFRGTGVIASASRVLHLYNSLAPELDEQHRIATISARCALPPSAVDQWIQAARELCSSFDVQSPTVASSTVHEKLTVPAPDTSIHVDEVEAMQYLASRLEEVEHISSELLHRALALVPSRFNRRRNDVAFRGPKDEIASRLFLKLLDTAGLTTNRVQLVVRRVDKNDLRLPSWFRTPRAANLPVRREPPPGTEANQAKAYAKWVGIRLCSKDGKAQGAAWRWTLFLACVAFGACTPT